MSIYQKGFKQEDETFYISKFDIQSSIFGIYSLKMILFEVILVP